MRHKRNNDIFLKHLFYNFSKADQASERTAIQRCAY